MGCGAHTRDGSGRVTSVLLATASPRRRRLFSLLGVPFRVAAFETPEELDSPLAADPPALAAHLAAEKALAALSAGEAARGEVVAAFDTIVELDGRLLGKPADLDEARAMLRALSGSEHSVVTGVALACPWDDEPRTFSVATPVRMRELSEDDIDAWVAKGELLGCAGAYNIESHLACVEDTECFQNVAGLPVCHLYAVLVSGAVPCAPEGLTPPAAGCDAARGARCALGPTIVEGAGS